MDEEDYQSVADSFASEQPSTLISSQHCFGKTWSVLGIFRKLTDRSQDPEHQTLLSRMCGEGLGTRLRLCCMRGWNMGMRLCESLQIVLLDYMEIYIHCESGLALASFLPTVVDRK